MNRTKKFITKRIRITKSGKLLRRGTGQNHYNAKMPGKKTRSRRADQLLAKSDVKVIKKYL